MQTRDERIFRTWKAAGRENALEKGRTGSPLMITARRWRTPIREVLAAIARYRAFRDEDREALDSITDPTADPQATLLADVTALAGGDDRDGRAEARLRDFIESFGHLADPSPYNAEWRKESDLPKAVQSAVKKDLKKAGA